MIATLRVSHDPEAIDAGGFVPDDKWEEFTNLFTDGIERAVRHGFPGLELEVLPAYPDEQKDRVECNCHCVEPCVHDDVLHWLYQEDNWLRGLDYAFREMERADASPDEMTAG